MPADGGERLPHVVSERAPLEAERIDDLAPQPEPTRLKAVEAVNEIDVLGDVERRLRQDRTRDGLRVDRQRSGALHRERRIENTNFHGPEFRLRPEVPVEV